ncbi:MAG: GlsB/YeaQ/YmgE family stress response membrane protein [Actinobacteria bacterium]|nr:MAG: GlsB/YeaQ/YmgE family stress response membrane protein [Actinomycetota bacterium]TML78839.1 MAG: GlsB/YeaQ/YmgE family stress response membrane protein [Actinomycetota bacterium]
MSLIVYIIVLFLSGLFVGALARLALPGPDPMTLLQTAVVGIAGSFLAGVVWAILFHRNGGGVLLSVLFATGIVYLVRRSRGGDLTNPGAPRRPR